jgi:hypothetical protein
MKIVQLTLGSLTEVLKKTLSLDSNSTENILNLLFQFVVDENNLCNKAGDIFYIDKTMASRLLNNKDNVPLELQNAVAFIKEHDALTNYFRDNLPFKPEKDYSFIKRITDIIKADKGLSDRQREEYLGLARLETVYEFLTRIFIYCVMTDNKKSVEKKTSTQERYHPLTQIEYSDDVDEEESKLPYLTSLLDAYSDCEKGKITLEVLNKYPKYEQNLSRQRKSYYAAETLRRGPRDVYGEDENDQFEILKEETFDGVIDVWEMDYDHGFDCLNAVMAQASQIRVDRCILARETNWIGNSEKKGVCHILVNNQRIKGWVK